ncbi:hypothetical protein BEI_1685 [Halomonas beimenensis]|uniref:Uncharacterized protein n=1 Tax=Halomonas beimenensis TaxID=475662 RepID=A0A291P735_9GAMM|nr:hypothetical protein BEI_1685 [Halomonas beimenensis]
MPRYTEEHRQAVVPKLLPSKFFRDADLVSNLA